MKNKLIFIFILIISLFYINLLKAKSYTKRLIPQYSFLGKQHSGRIGYCLSSAGDVNCDGYSDFIVGSYHTSLHGWNSGAVFLLMGGSNKEWELNTSIMVADAIFRGKQEFDMVGYHIAGLGDFNGDGYDDVLIGAPGNWEREPAVPGSVYIVFGKENPEWGQDFVLEDCADKIIIGETDLDQFGYAVGFIGDINHDGYDDILCGAPFRNEFDEWDGKAYLILGSDDKIQRLSVCRAAIASFVFPGYKGKLGSSVAGVDDVNQDGFVDFMIGAPGIGTSFLILGKRSFDWGLNYNLDHADCIFLPEDTNHDDAGWQVKSAGDVNRDGYPDILISGLEILYEKGKVYLVFGRKNWQQEFLLAQADASFIGESGRNHAGVSIDGVKDFTGDGYDDFVIGARYYGNSDRTFNSGKAYLIAGKSSGWTRDVSLQQIDTYFVGEDTLNLAGWGVSYAGDVDGDCRNNFIVSAPFCNEAGHLTGEVYVFKGEYAAKQISGNTLYYSNSFPVSDVALRLRGDVNDQSITNERGEYLFSVAGGAHFEVIPEKMIGSDISHHAITMYDAALTAAYIAKKKSLSPLAQVAADVNLDGTITMADVNIIAYHSIKFPPTDDSHVGEWKFNPEIREYSWIDLSTSNQNYDCIVLGDVSGNWKPSDIQEVAYQKSIIGGEVTSTTEIISVPLSIPNSSSMISAEVELNFDHTIFEFLGIEKTRLINDFKLTYNLLNEHKLLLGLYGITPVHEAGEILKINFKTINKGVTSSHIELAKFQINDGLLSNSIIYVERVNKKNYGLLSNYPNPFNARTVIHYHLNKPAEVTLKIYNINGQEIKTLVNEYKTCGNHQVIWDGVDKNGTVVVSGVYICCLSYNEFVETRKLIMLK